jgi:hypothetical protein
MAATSHKQTLLETLRAARDREVVLVEACEDRREGDPETWTARDHLVHLAHWRWHAAEVLNGARAGGAPEPVASIDEINARVHAANRDRAAWLVIEDARGSFDALFAAIEVMTDEQLLTQRPGRSGALWEVVPGNGHLHTGQHLGFWRQSRGEEGAAEEIQLWMRDLHIAAFPTTEQGAYAEYNLGCYYALQLRAAEAIPLLVKAFGLKPDLVELARTDHDLDAIRERAEIQRLLA